MSHTYIEMYNANAYDSWEQAWDAGGVYITVVFSVDEPRHGAGFAIMEDMRDAIETACVMMDGSYKIKTRTRIGPVTDRNYIHHTD
jgi:hypothetical protein